MTDPDQVRRFVLSAANLLTQDLVLSERALRLAGWQIRCRESKRQGGSRECRCVREQTGGPIVPSDD